MKFNLKNRPGPEMDGITWEKWAEGFEKELRELLSYYDDPRPKSTSKYAKARIDLIREILGEATP